MERTLALSFALGLLLPARAGSPYVAPPEAMKACVESCSSSGSSSPSHAGDRGSNSRSANPNASDGNTYFAHGKSLVDAGRYAEASEYFRRVIQLERRWPNDTSARPIHAFLPAQHKVIVETALGDGNKMDQQALNWIIQANLASDDIINQTDSRRHFDNAQDPTALCRLWEDGVKKWFDAAVESVAPKGDDKTELVNRQQALEVFGLVTHAVADFYSHTNWVELWLHKAAPLPVAPLVGTSCDPSAFPDQLQSGWFDVSKKGSPISGPSEWGCPAGGPPAPFKYCHRDLSKDYPDVAHGHDVADGEATYNELAAALAMRATGAAWEALHDRIIARYQQDGVTDGECLFMKLGWGGNRSCHRYWELSGELKFTGNWAGVTDHQALKGTLEISSNGLDARVSWTPVRYPGPHAPPVTAPITGSWTLKGAALAHNEENDQVFSGTCDRTINLNQQGVVDGLLKVQPTDDAWESTSFVKLWNSRLRTLRNEPSERCIASGRPKIATSCLSGNCFFTRGSRISSPVIPGLEARNPLVQPVLSV